jgi:hypothetical protein
MLNHKNHKIYSRDSRKPINIKNEEWLGQGKPKKKQRERKKENGFERDRRISDKLTWF